MRGRRKSRGSPQPNFLSAACETVGVGAASALPGFRQPLLCSRPHCPGKTFGFGCLRGFGGLPTDIDSPAPGGARKQPWNAPQPSGGPGASNPNQAFPFRQGGRGLGLSCGTLALRSIAAPRRLIPLWLGLGPPHHLCLAEKGPFGKRHGAKEKPKPRIVSAQNLISPFLPFVSPREVEFPFWRSTPTPSYAAGTSRALIRERKKAPEAEKTAQMQKGDKQAAGNRQGAPLQVGKCITRGKAPLILRAGALPCGLRGSEEVKTQRPPTLIKKQFW